MYYNYKQIQLVAFPYLITQLLENAINHISVRPRHSFARQQHDLQPQSTPLTAQYPNDTEQPQ